MKALIDRILRSAQRLQEFWELRKETQAAEYAFRREARLHLRQSFQLWLKTLRGRWYNGK
jgi:hypothetical protein